MEVIVSGRHLEVEADERLYAEGKFQQLGEEYTKLTTCRLVLTLERGQVIAEGHIHGKHVNLNAVGKADAIRVAVDAVFEKLERQLRRYLERIQTHRGPSLGETEQIVENMNAEKAEEDDIEDEDDEVELDLGA